MFAYRLLDRWAANPATNLDRFASYSNYGTPDITLAGPGGDFALPGEALCTVATVLNRCWVLDMVLSTGNSPSPGPARYSWAAGTSMAAPHVAGVAALIIGKNGGQMDPVRVEAALKASADDRPRSLLWPGSRECIQSNNGRYVILTFLGQHKSSHLSKRVTAFMFILTQHKVNGSNVTHNCWGMIQLRTLATTRRHRVRVGLPMWLTSGIRSAIPR